MNTDTLNRIKQECEKIEKEPGFGKVLITIEHGRAIFIHPTPTIMLPKGLDKCLPK